MSSYKLSCLFALSLFIACPTIEAGKKRGIVVQPAKEFKAAIKFILYALSAWAIVGIKSSTTGFSSTISKDALKLALGSVITYGIGDLGNIASLRTFGWMLGIAAGALGVAEHKKTGQFASYLESTWIPTRLAFINSLIKNESARALGLYIPVKSAMQYIGEYVREIAHNPTRHYIKEEDDED